MEDNPEPEKKEFDDADIERILKEALTVRLREKRKLPKKNELNNALIGILGEFLSCYRIIGYDLDGNPVNMVIYRENMQKSALDNAFAEEIGKFMMNRI